MRRLLTSLALLFALADTGLAGEREDLQAQLADVQHHRQMVVENANLWIAHLQALEKILQGRLEQLSQPAAAQPPTTEQGGPHG